MPELVGSMSFGQSKVTTELLKTIGYKEVEPLTDELKSRLSSDDMQCILLYRPLAATLQFAVDQAKDFESLIQGWMEQSTLLISLVKSHRQRVLLFNEKDLSLSPQSFVEHIHAKGLLKALPESYPESTGNAPSSFSQFIATELMRRDPVLNRLESQLLALSQPLVDVVEPLRINPLQVMKDYQQLKSKCDQLNRESKTLKTNNNDISSQLESAQASVSSLQKQLEEQTLTSEKVTADLATLTKKYVVLEQQQLEDKKSLAHKTDQINEFEKSDATLRQQIAGFESAIKEHEKRISAFKGDLGVKNEKISTLEAEKSELSQRLESMLEEKENALAALAESLETLQAELNTNGEVIKTLTADKEALALQLADLEKVNALKLSNLCAEKDALEQTLLQTSAEAQNKQVELDMLNGQLLSLSQNYQDAQNEVSTLLEQLHSVQEALESRTHAHQQVLADKEQIHKELSESIAKHAEAFEKLNDDKAEVERCLADALSEGERKQTDLNVFAQSLETINAELKNAKTENTLLLEQLHFVQEALETKTHEHQKVLADKEQIHKELSESVARYAKVIEKLNDDKAEVERCLTDALSEGERKQADLNASAQALQALNVEHQTVQTENELLLEQLHAVQEEFELQHIESVRLKDEGQQLSDTIRALEKQLTEATQAWSISDQSAARLGTEVLSLQKEKSAWQVDKQRLSKDISQLSALKAVNEQTQLQCHELNSVITGLEQEKKALLERIARMDQVANNVQIKLQELEKTISQERNKVRDLQSRVDSASVQAPVSTGYATAGAMDSLAGLQEENSLLIEQLHFVQEELERYFIKYRETEQNENRLLTSVPSLLSALRKYPYAQVSKTRHTLILRHVFDEKWYLNTYSDVAKSPAASKAPFMHFLHHGFFEGRNPRADLETLTFVQTHPEILSGPLHPVVSWAEYLNQP